MLVTITKSRSRRNPGWRITHVPAQKYRGRRKAARERPSNRIVATGTARDGTVLARIRIINSRMPPRPITRAPKA